MISRFRFPQKWWAQTRTCRLNAEAAWWFVNTERNCQAQLLAEAAGTPTLIDHENAKFTAEQTGTPYMGWFSFQPLWDEVVRTDPDLFD